MKFVLEIDTDNAAFDEDDELGRLIREVAGQVDNGREEDGCIVLDLNGNSVGFWAVKEPKRPKEKA